MANPQNAPSRPVQAPSHGFPAVVSRGRATSSDRSAGPALQMSRELSSDRRALPVLKVLHRNARCLHDSARAGASDTLALFSAGETRTTTAADLREAVRARDLPGGENVFAGLARGTG
ncbi:MAG: hypothetical protein EXS06_01740 [Planctomycetaceae bacterium]|nr:hypothetical protein [Planctomycetaceae bacterium]